MKKDVIFGSCEFGEQIKFYRGQKRLSQVDLAALAGTTPRHLSFLETGRSRPRMELIIRLANCLELSPRQTNVLCRAAGLRACYPESAIQEGSLKEYRSAIQMVLDRHNPYPGCAMDRLGRIVLANQTFRRFSPGLMEKSAEELVDEFFGDGPTREMVLNWQAQSWNWIDRMHAEFLRTGDSQIAKLIDRAKYHLRKVPRPVELPSGAVQMSTFQVNDQIIQTFSTVMRFEAAQDVTLSEIRVELIFPFDEDAAAFFEELATDGSSS